MSNPTVTAVVTAKSGPGNTLTAASFTGLAGFLFSADRKMLYLNKSGDVQTPPEVELDIAAATTFTLVLANNVYTLTVT